MVQFIFVDTATKTIPISWESIEESNVNNWLAALLPGLDEQYTVLVCTEPYSRPPVDERLMTITTNEAFVDEYHPVYTQVKQWQKTYTVTEKNAADKKAAVDIKENEANETTIPYEKRLKATTLAVWSLMKFLSLQTNDQINATSLSAKDKKRLRLFRQIALKINNNDTERDNKHALIDAATNPNIDANWDLNNYTETV